MQKKYLSIFTLICGILLTSCGGNKYKLNEWFSSDKLEECFVKELPELTSVDYLKHKEDDIYLLAFEMLSDDDRISIKYINNKVKEEKFLDIINYLNNILVVKTHLIIDLYVDKFMNVLDNKFKCKEVYVSLVKDDIIDNNSKYREELVEIDMYNIRYLFSKNEIICNLVKQNIQDERLILELNSKFITMDNSVISFIISDDMIDLFTKELGYDIIYKSYVIVKES